MVVLSLLMAGCGGGSSGERKLEGELVRELPAGRYAIVADDERVWFTGETTLLAHDARTARPVAESPAAQSDLLALGEGFLWSEDSDDLNRFDARSGRPAGSARSPDEAIVSDIAVGEGAVWATTLGGRRPVEVTRTDPRSLRTRRGTIPGVGDAVEVAAGEGVVWVMVEDEEQENRGLLRIDPETLEPVGTPITGGEPNEIALGEGALWVADGRNIRRLDPATGREQAEIEAELPDDGALLHVAVGAGYIWALSSGAGDADAYLVRADPRTGRLVGEPARVAVNAGGLAVGGGSAWVLDAGRTPEVDPTVEEIPGALRRVRP
jgi:hypothetical protein